MNKIKLASTLKNLLEKQKLTESELARKTGVGQPVIHRMASGETDNPKIETLRPIAKYFSISIDQLVGDAPLTYDSPVFQIEQELFNVPLISLKDATQWPTIQNSPFHVQTDIKITAAAYAIRLKDSTMYPMFPDGTLLIIEPNQPYRHKDFVVAYLESESQAVFKQLLIDGNHHYLKSVNNEYPLKQLEPSDKILGVMMQARIDFRSN